MKPVLVTTAHRGVFFGYVSADSDLTAETLRLERAQMCVHWTADVRGVLGLAVSGPSANCRVGPAVPAITLQKVTSVTETTPEAANAWAGAPWR